MGPAVGWAVAGVAGSECMEQRGGPAGLVSDDGGSCAGFSKGLLFFYIIFYCIYLIVGTQLLLARF